MEGWEGFRRQKKYMCVGVVGEGVGRQNNYQ